MDIHIAADRVTQNSDLKPEVERIFRLQKNNQQRVADTSARERKEKLERMRRYIMNNRAQIRKAVYDDFRKSAEETDIGEIYKIITEIKFAKTHLSGWMQRKYVDTPLAQAGTSSYIHYEPKGVVLIMSPWNFPFILTLGPLVSAVAAGNCIMIKPSEYCPHSSALMKKMISELFDEQEVAVIEGGVAAATELLKLPFNHIFFTGAPEIGKVVMKAAAEHLTSVTLELGGKSPTIIDETAGLKTAARRIAYAKWFNCGQICIAPDYVLVQESVAEKFLQELKKTLTNFYGGDASKSETYNRMVNHRHFQRVEGYYNDALAKGAKTAYGGVMDGSQDYISPTIMTHIPHNSDLWEKEIFGPILPFVTYTDLQQAVNWINQKEKPLALYIFSKSNKNTEYIIRNTRAGGTCINHAGLHFFNDNLPFGGSNNSGIGKANGFYGFESFSNARAVLKQWSPVNALDILKPPYTKTKRKLIDLTIKWL